MKIAVNLVDWPIEAFEKEFKIYERPAISFRPCTSCNFERQQKIQIHSGIPKKGETPSKIDTIETELDIFTTGCFEHAIKWKENLELILKRKPIEDAQGKFDFMLIVLDGEAKVRWNRINY